MKRIAVIAALVCGTAVAQNTGTVDNLSTNQQGSNNSNNSNNPSSTTNYNGAGSSPGSTPPPSAIAPSLMGGGTDSCLIPITGAVSSTVIGFSGGTYVRDENCERLKLSKVLKDAGLAVASISLLCQDARVYQAMVMSGTPCPAWGVIGKQATIVWQQNPKMRPDYKGNEDALLPLYTPGKTATSAGDSDSSLSDRFRPSKRSVPDANPAGGNQ